MSEIFHGVILYLENLAQKVPLELFTVIGTFLEEVVAPIPSPLVMTLSGSIMRAQNKAITYIALIALIGAIGKTLGAWVLYFLSDIAENIIVGVFGKFLGLDSDSIENIGKKFNGNWKDVVTVCLNFSKSSLSEGKDVFLLNILFNLPFFRLLYPQNNNAKIITTTSISMTVSVLFNPEVNRSEAARPVYPRYK